MSKCACRFMETKRWEPVPDHVRSAIETTIPRELFHLLMVQRAYIAGGALRSLWLKETPRDYDIYAPRPLAGHVPVAKDCGFIETADLERPHAPSDPRGGFELVMRKGLLILDFIHLKDRVGSPEQVLNGFCLHHQQLAYPLGEQNWLVGATALACIRDKRIELHKDHTCSQKQVKKCVKKWLDAGWTE